MSASGSKSRPILNLATMFIALPLAVHFLLVVFAAVAPEQIKE